MFDWHQSLEGFVAASRRAQGLPERVEDPATLAKVAVLLRSGAAARFPEGNDQASREAAGRAAASV